MRSLRLRSFARSEVIVSILDHLVSISEELVWQARRRVLQRRTLELLELQEDTEAVRRGARGPGAGLSHRA